jgi:hypothetical protein
MNAEKHLQWNDLLNALVEIRHSGSTVRTGFVDDAMPDSSVVWIAPDGSRGRKLFEASEGYELWVKPQPLEGDLQYRMTVQRILGEKGPEAR